MAEILLAWLAIVVVTMLIVSYLSLRWGHDPFGWLMLSAAMGPIAIAGLVSARLASGAGGPRTAPARADGSGDTTRILAAVDGSAAGGQIGRHIVDTYGTGADVVVLAVLPHEARPDTSERAREDQRALVEQMTGATLATLAAGGVPARPSVAYGEAGEEIVRRAVQDAPDLIVVGRRGSGLSRALLGSVSDYVVMRARCPVTVIG